MNYKYVSTEEGLEALQAFLAENGIETKLYNPPEIGLCRTITFSVNDTEYCIVWYVNESMLQIGTSKRAARIPFKYIFLDTTYPLEGGNKSIGFAYNKYKQESVFDRQFPYEVFRIPTINAKVEAD